MSGRDCVECKGSGRVKVAGYGGAVIRHGSKDYRELVLRYEGWLIRLVEKGLPLGKKVNLVEKCEGFESVFGWDMTGDR